MSFVSLAALDAASVTYPSTRTVNQVDAYHGISVRDPDSWLEEVDSEETVAWVNAQRAVTESFFRTIPERGTIRARLDALTNIPRSGIPVKQGGRYFSSHNTGLQNQPTLRMRTTLDAAPTVVLDPNQLASDGTVALTAYAGSPDGRWLAYALSRSGSDWNEYRIKDLITGEDTADTLRWVKFSRMSWTHERAPSPDLHRRQGRTRRRQAHRQVPRRDGGHPRFRAPLHALVGPAAGGMRPSHRIAKPLGSPRRAALPSDG